MGAVGSMTMRPPAVRTLCLLRRDDQVLLLRRRRPPNAGLWNAVGGKVAPGEDPWAACVREVFEETGMRIARPRLRAVEFVSVRPASLLWVLLVFVAVAPPGEPVASDEGELHWVQVDAVPTLPVPVDLGLLWPILWDRDQVMTVRVDLEGEDASTMTRMAILGPADRARPLYPP